MKKFSIKTIKDEDIWHVKRIPDKKICFWHSSQLYRRVGRHWGLVLIRFWNVKTHSVSDVAKRAGTVSESCDNGNSHWHVQSWKKTKILIVSLNLYAETVNNSSR